MKKILFIILLIGFFQLVQKCIATATPWPRLLLIPMFIVFAYYRKSFQAYLQYVLNEKWMQKVIFCLFIIVSVIRMGVFVRKLYQPVRHQEDIAQVYVKAINAWWYQGHNPYKLALDPYPIWYNGQKKVFAGPKYPPLQILLYAPFVVWFHAKGIYIGNAIAYFGMLLFIMWLLRKASITSAYLAGSMYLATDYFFTKAFMKGINDFIPTALALAFFYLFQRKKDTYAGILLGLSAAAKQLPAGIFLLLMLCYRKGKIVFMSGIVFCVVTLPWVINGALLPFWQNTILFNLYRPARMGSFQYLMPAKVGQLLFVTSLLFIIITSLRATDRYKFWNLSVGYGHIVSYITIFLLTAKMSPAHYFVWSFPFFVLWVFDLSDYNSKK